MLGDEAGLERTERRHSHEHEGVERHHPAPQLVGNEGLEHGVGERGGHDHGAAGECQEHQCHPDGADYREQHQQRAERGAAVQQRRTLANAAPAEREPERAEHRPDAHRRHEHSVAAGVGVQHVPGDHRHQHDEREAEHAEHGDQHDERRHTGVAPDERDGLAHPLAGRGGRAVGPEGGEAHRQEPGDDGDVAHPVQQEAQADAGRTDHHARDGRADDPRRVEHGRVQRDRIHQVVPAHEFRDERLAAGNVERIDDPEEHRHHHHLPRRHPAGPHERRQRQRFEHLQRLGPHDEGALVHAVHDDTRVQCEQQHAQGAERLGQADGERRVGDLEHQPPERDRLHPGPDERDALTEEEEPEVAVGKRSEAKRARGGGFVHCGKARRRPIFRVGSPMKYTTYSRYLPELADTVNLQALLDQLADFLLQSGFAGGAYSHPFWGEFGEEESDRSLDALRQAILQALMDSGQLTPEMLKVLRGESTGDAARDADLERQLGELLDKIVQKLIDEGYLNVTEAPKVPSGQQPLFGPGGMAKEAAQQVQFNLTEKGIDFLGYRTLKHLLGSIGKSSFGAHETEHLATGIEAEAGSKPYEYGDTLNLDVNATLTNALQREGLGVPINLEYDDLLVHQAEYRSSSATVLMLDCSHSMILYGEDRFTPAKKVALALTHLIRTQFPGDTLRVVLFHDTAEEIPLAQLARAQVGPYHTNTAEGLKLSRRMLLSQRKDMRQIIMITDGKPSALTLPDGRIYVNSMGLDPQILQATYREVALCRRSGILINTFMLARDRSLVEFVKKVSAICRGKAYFTNTMTLGQFILMDFMRRKTRRVS